MTSSRNEARARRGDPKRSNKTRAQSDDVTDSVQIGPSGATSSAPQVAQPEDVQERIRTTDDDREAYRQPAIARYPTESVIPTRPVAPPLEARSQTYPRAVGHISPHEAHLVYPPMTSFGGWNTHSGNATTSAVERSHNYEPTTIRDSTLSNTTRHVNNGDTFYIENLNLSLYSMQDGRPSTTDLPSSANSHSSANADLPTTSTATSNSYDTWNIHDQPHTAGADSHINPRHFVSSQHTQQQPLSNGPSHGMGGPSQIPGSNRSKRPTSRKVGEGSSRRTSGTARSMPLPRDVQGAEHFEGDVFEEPISSQANVGYAGKSSARERPSLQGDVTRRSTQSAIFWKSAGREEVSPDDGFRDETSLFINQPQLMGMGQKRESATSAENDSPQSLAIHIEDAISEEIYKNKSRVNERRYSNDSWIVVPESSHGPFMAVRRGSPNIETASTLSSGSSTVKGPSLSSSLVQEGNPANRDSPLNTLTESTTDDDSNHDDDDAVDNTHPVPSSNESSSTGHSNLGVIREGQQVTEQPLPKSRALGNPRLVAFRNNEGREWILKKTIEKHIPVYMRSGDILYTGSETIHLLWDPCPTLLRKDGQNREIMVGDLVYLTDGGEVQVIFNLLHSYEDNKDTGATPPPKPYEHLGDILSPDDHVKVEEIQKQKCYFSDGIERVSNLTRTSETRYHFKTTKKHRNGAIIVLPHGGVDRYLQDNFFQLPKVKQHFRKHAPSWYHHAKSRDVPNLKNGSLFLVRRTYSARTWGIATFGSKGYDKIPIKAEFAQNGSDQYEYLWEPEDNRLKTNRGPSRAQLRALRGGEPPLNQCIGMSLSSLQLDEDTWQNSFPSKSNPTTPEKASSSPLRRWITNSSSDVSNGRQSAQSRQSKQTHWSSWMERVKGKRKDGAESLHNASQADFTDYRLLYL